MKQELQKIYQYARSSKCKNKIKSIDISVKQLTLDEWILD